MKIAVMNFSGNVGKSTIARHLLTPRIKGAELVSVESINADESEGDALRGKDFAQLQQYMQTVDNLVVDIGASNVEDLLNLMKRFKGSHEDFDYFVVPTVPDKKQQNDTATTCQKLLELGVDPSRIKIVFNMVEDDVRIEQVFNALQGFLLASKAATFDANCKLTTNEIYQLVKHDGRNIAQLAADKTDFKGLIAKAKDQAEKIELADKLAIKRLASGVLPELDDCFKALALA